MINCLILDFMLAVQYTFYEIKNELDVFVNFTYIV